jgi:tyrosine decarboxylase/aspartate 1-decarboxylase
MAKMQFPSKGISESKVMSRLKDYRKQCSLHRTGMNWGMGFYPYPIAMKAYDEFVDSNMILGGAAASPTNPFSGLFIMEEECVSMMGSVLGLTETRGNITSGGTESNFLALKVARDSSKKLHGSVVFSTNAHPSLVKGCRLLGLEPIRAKTGADFLTDADAMRNAVRDDTIGIVGTCGTHTHGAIDPIEEIGEIAEDKNLYYHVDAAWGGLVCCWLQRAGLYDIPPFDFNVKKVDSITVDPHKGGYVPMPAGGILFRNEEHHKLAGFELVDGKFGNYFSWTLQGSRTGGPVAATWAMFNYMGENGYLKITKKCMDLTYKMIKRIRKIPGLTVPVEPKMNIFATYSNEYDLLALIHEMEGKGWSAFHLNVEPPSFRLVVLPHHERKVEKFLNDLENSAGALKKKQK